MELRAMRVICSWCEAEGKPAVVREKEPLEDSEETHGVCPAHKASLSTPDVARSVGIDLGGAAIHCVALSDDGRVIDALVLASKDIPGILEWVSGATAIAVDAPEDLSRALHADDQTLSPKFRRGRCAEIELGRAHKIWVPWVTPTTLPATEWMEVGFRLFSALKASGHHAIEVFPYAGFCALNASGLRLPSKDTVDGGSMRAALLAARGIKEPFLRVWSHDGVDALLAALIAMDWKAGRARRVTCGHDESAIWLPG
jgi:predicted nuclease with RNAse H fold